MDIKQITEQQLSALSEALYFLEAFVEYHICEEPIEPGTRTDAQELSDILPTLSSVFDNEPVTLSEPAVEEPAGDGERMYTQEEVDNLIYNAKKDAAESVNPNNKFCVVDSSLHECYVTDDEADAMVFAIKKSRTKGMWNVCRIFKANDGTYKTRVIAFADDGDYHESSSLHTYLHFNYIAEACGEVKKI